MIEITTDALPVGLVNEPYKFQLTAKTDSKDPIQWSTLNDLPKGFTLDPISGELTGLTDEIVWQTIFFHAETSPSNQTQKPLTLSIQEDDMQLLIGSIIPYAGEVNESNRKDLESKGWLVCDGSVISRETYNQLFGVITILYGGGDGVNTFNLPDYRGQFLRGISGQSGVDPDSEKRTGQKNSIGTSGTASGDMVGTFQQDEFHSHNHSLPKWNRSFKGSDDPDKPFDDKGSETGYTNESGGSETRPKNVYVNYLIRFK